MSATQNDLTHTSSERIKLALSSLRDSPKLMLVICAAAALSVVIALLFWVKEPGYKVLFSGISDEDGGAIVSQLVQMNIPYRIDNAGGSIMVPDAQVHEARMKLAQQGLPKGGAVGFELMDQEKFGISQFGEQINYQRALEGELARTIEKLGPIRSARVHLATPKPSMFIREQKQPTASVTVNLIAGRLLEEGQVVAITHLISSAVTGLSADKVTIVDQRGNLLTQEGEGGHPVSQLKYIHKVETDYQQRIQHILAPLVGEGNVRAQVTAQIDFIQKEQTQEQYQPNTDQQKMAVRSRQSSQSAQGNRSGNGGVPGALTNLPPTPATAPVTRPIQAPEGANQGTAAPVGSDSALPYNNRNDETTNFEIDRTLTHTTLNTGRIERLSVAVVINHLPQGEDGSAKPLAEAELARISSLVKEAIGYSEARGDRVNILNSPFNGLVDEPLPPFWQQERFHVLVMTLAQYLFVVIIAWVMWRKLVQPAWQRQQETRMRQLELEKEARNELLAAKKREAEKEASERAQLRVNSELNSQQLREIALQDARIIALVIRQWMNKELKS